MEQKIKISRLRRLIREELVREFDETEKASSRAAVAIAKGIGAFLGGNEMRSQLQGMEGEDPDKIFTDVNKMLQLPVIRNPLNKLAHDVSGQQQQAQPKLAPRGKPEQDGDNSDERPTMMPPPPRM